MTVDALIVQGKKRIHSTTAKMILADMLNMNPLELITVLDQELDPQFVEDYLKKISLIENNEPVQYVIGNVNFYGLKLEVNSSVLIPRFETEELVENTLHFMEEHFQNKNLKVLDLGCGSGAIGLSIKSQVPDCSVTLLDISYEALDVSKKNSFQLGLDVSFLHNDMLDGITEKYDVIISNPPYIKEGEEIEEIVKNNEPHLALYAGVDGLDCYRKILSQVKNNLKDSFLLAFEIGYEQKNDIVSLIQENLGDVEIICKKDLSEKDRMIFVMNKK